MVRPICLCVDTTGLLLITQEKGFSSNFPFTGNEHDITFNWAELYQPLFCPLLYVEKIMLQVCVKNIHIFTYREQCCIISK